MDDQSGMEALRERVGRRVQVNYVKVGRHYERIGILTEVRDFVSIKLDGEEIHFVGRRSAIREIWGEDGMDLFSNQQIPKNYRKRGRKIAEGLREQCFEKETLARKEGREKGGRIWALFQWLRSWF